MNDLKKYIKDLVYSVKNAFSSKDDKDDLDKIIERKYEKVIESLHKYGIIEYIEREYKIKYKKPKLEIYKGGYDWWDEDNFLAKYLPSGNKIVFSKLFIENKIDYLSKYLDYKETKISISYMPDLVMLELGLLDHFSPWENSEFLEYKIQLFKKSAEAIDKQLESLGYKEKRDIDYLNRAYYPILLYPFYINEENMRNTIAKFFILSVMFHEFWHSIDYRILRKLSKIYYKVLSKLSKNSTIKDRDYLLTILNDHDNFELRASAFEVVMYYLVNGFHKDERGYMATYANIPTCRNYIERLDILEKNKYEKSTIPYDLGLCYGNIIVARYGPSLKENIYKIIDDIIHLNKEKAIDEIKLYGDNPDKLLHD